MNSEKRLNTIANPSPLGLIGFSLTAILLNLHNAGITKFSVVIIAMGLALGGTAQIIAGIMEFLRNNTFGATTFTAYGLYWWTQILIWLNPFPGVEAADLPGSGWYLLLWGIFTLFMFVGTLRLNRVSQLQFLSLAALYFLLAAGNFTGNVAFARVGGYAGLFSGASAMYCSVGQILNELYGKQVVPL